MTSSGPTAPIQPDAAAGNWIDRHAPASMRPYLHLVRLDRPIGVWLLLWPCWWALALAAPLGGRFVPDLRLLALFAAGAVIMRGAGCIWNDLADRRLDAQVARTALRPVASGQVSPGAALAFMGLLLLAGLIILLQLNGFSVVLGVLALGPVAFYPFAKRVTWWPQAVLGVTFSWGALLGWSAVTGGLDLPAAALYGAAVAWTLGYDTIYAHQDTEDDALIGVRSSARRLGDRSKPWIAAFYGLAVVLLAVAGALMGVGPVYYFGLGFGAWHLARQVRRLDVHDPARCLAVFRSNRDFGLIVFCALVAGALGGSVPAGMEQTPGPGVMEPAR